MLISTSHFQGLKITADTFRKFQLGAQLYKNRWPFHHLLCKCEDRLHRMGIMALVKCTLWIYVERAITCNYLSKLNRF